MAVSDRRRGAGKLTEEGAELGWYPEPWLLKKRRDQNKRANKTPKHERVGEPGSDGA